MSSDEVVVTGVVGIEDDVAALVVALVEAIVEDDDAGWAVCGGLLSKMSHQWTLRDVFQVKQAIVKAEAFAKRER